MGEYLSPNVFIEERRASAGSVAGVSTSTYATAGWLQKGPVNRPQLITSFAAFVNTFGSYWRKSVVPHTVALFFSQGSGRAYVSRIVPTDAVKAALSSGAALGCINGPPLPAIFVGKPLPATLDLSVNSYIAVQISGGATVEIDCVGSVPAATTRAEIVAAIAAVPSLGCALTTANELRIYTLAPGETSSLVFMTPATGDASLAILGVVFESSTPLESLSVQGRDMMDWSYQAAYAGAWYNQVRMCISGNPDYEDATGNFSLFDVEIQEESSLGAGDWETKETYTEVVFDDDDNDQFVSDVVSESTQFQKIIAGSKIGKPYPLVAVQMPCEPCGGTPGVSATGTLKNIPVVPGSVVFHAYESVNGWGEVVDDGDGNLSMTQGTFTATGTIAYDTGQWSITFSVAFEDFLWVEYYIAPPSTTTCCQLTGGTDGTSVGRNDISAIALSATKAGIYSFDTIDEILNLSLPDFAGDISVTDDLNAYAMSRGDRFIIGATPQGKSSVDVVKWMRKTALYNSKMLAVYWPWVQIGDPLTRNNRPMDIAPDGVIAGVFARNDTLANVGTSPGGTVRGVMNGILGLERDVVQGDRDIVSPARINVLRVDSQVGKAVWGVRTTSLDAEWRYINHTRLFMFCEKSLYNASFWIVFENNGPALWMRAKTQFDGFFHNLWKDGYLAGEAPNEAFFVKIDKDNNPQSAIDAGLFTADCYIAPHKPAEFVRLRFQQLLKQQ